MLKTMKLLLAAAFLLAGLSLAGCKNCKEESSMSSPNAMTPSSDVYSHYVYFVNQKTGRPLIGDGKDQIPLGAVEMDVPNQKAVLDSLTGNLIFGLCQWPSNRGCYQNIFFQDKPGSSRTIHVVQIDGVKKSEILDECNSRTWVEYSYYDFPNPGSGERGTLKTIFRGDGMTDTLRIEVER